MITLYGLKNKIGILVSLANERVIPIDSRVLDSVSQSHNMGFFQEQVRRYEAYNTEDWLFEFSQTNAQLFSFEKDLKNQVSGEAISDQE